MAWYDISTAEIAPRQPLDSELFSKIRNNLNIGFCAIALPYVIPNGSFEFSTGTAPSLWTINTTGGGAAAISTVSAHGGQSLKLTRSGTVARAVEVYTDDFLAVCATQVTIHGIIWATGATNTAIKGGVAVRTYSKDQTAISTVHDNHSSWTNDPTTYSMVCTVSSDTRFIKVGCVCASDSTVAGSLHFDGLYIRNT
jgi:hypothetical protein